MTRDKWRNEHGARLSASLEAAASGSHYDVLAHAILDAIEDHPEPTVWVDMLGTLRRIEAARDAEAADDKKESPR